ncbi:MAG: MGMT family protein [Actinomycetia bacterium]|nr:MGMT family protein [Actinomycetes bacterium]
MTHPAEPDHPDPHELRVERVLRAVEQVPRGRLVAYGDIGRLVGIGARQVGSIMRHWGGNVAWWRVTNASGQLPEHLREEARARWAAEGILPAGSGSGAPMAVYRADLTQLATDWERACADLEASAQ